MTIKQPMLEKVFLALRTNFVPEYHSEHITLEYFQEVRWDALLDIANKLDKILPATIHIKEKIEWQGFDSEPQKYNGFSVVCRDSNILHRVKMPHITVPKYILDMINPLDMEPIEVVDRLYLGKSINHKIVWATIRNNQIGPGNAAVNWPAITGNPNWDVRDFSWVSEETSD